MSPIKALDLLESAAVSYRGTKMDHELITRAVKILRETLGTGLKSIEKEVSNAVRPQDSEG